MIEGAIFDMDGVLVDNVSEHMQAFRLFGEEQGRTVSDDDIYAAFGQKNDAMLQSILGRTLSPEEVDRYGRRKEAIYRDLIRPSLRSKAVAGLSGLLANLQSAGIRMAVATSGPVENADLVLEGLELRSYFQAVVTGEQVTRGKPDPEAFLLAARRLGLPPAACVVFEDSPSGVRAALRAGCRCVALTTTHDRKRLCELGPQLIVDDFTELDLATLQSL
ncbi:MAG: HAD family phosphatase [Acidobacteriota bacterium]